MVRKLRLALKRLQRRSLHRSLFPHTVLDAHPRMGRAQRFDQIIREAPRAAGQMARHDEHRLLAPIEAPPLDPDRHDIRDKVIVVHVLDRDIDDGHPNAARHVLLARHRVGQRVRCDGARPAHGPVRQGGAPVHERGRRHKKDDTPVGVPVVRERADPRAVGLDVSGVMGLVHHEELVVQRAQLGCGEVERRRVGDDAEVRIGEARVPHLAPPRLRDGDLRGDDEDPMKHAAVLREERGDREGLPGPRGHDDREDATRGLAEGPRAKVDAVALVGARNARVLVHGLRLGCDGSEGEVDARPGRLLALGKLVPPRLLDARRHDEQIARVQREGLLGAGFQDDGSD